MKILVAGMGRSGSTALYNIIRISLKEAGIDFKCAYQDKHFNSKNSLIKHHGYTDELKNTSTLVFTTIRELKDCIGSHFRYTPENKGDRTLKELCDQYLHYHIVWKDHSDFEFVYEKFKNEPVTAIQEVIDKLGFSDVDANIVNEKLIEETKKVTSGKGSSGFDSKTLIFRNHITNGNIGSYKEHLSKDEVNWINENYSDWLKKNDYL